MRASSASTSWTADCSRPFSPIFPVSLAFADALDIHRQGRDNLLHLHSFGTNASASATVGHGAATAVPSPASPSTGIDRAWSLDINAMNFCRMSVCPLGGRSTKGKEREVLEDEEGEEALVAVPSLTKDDVVRWRLRLLYTVSSRRINR